MFLIQAVAQNRFQSCNFRTAIVSKDEILRPRPLLPGVQLRAKFEIRVELLPLFLALSLSGCCVSETNWCC